MVRQDDTTDRHRMFYWQVDRPFDARQTKEIFLDRYNHFNIQDAARAVEFGMIKSGLSKEHARVIEIKPPEKVLSSVNIICYATLANKQQVIVRIHPPEVKNGYFWVESEAAKHASAAGVPVYRTFYIYDGRNEFPYDFMLVERIPGKTMQLLWPIDPHLDRKLVEETGEYLAMIHSIKTDKYGFFDNHIAKDRGTLQGIHPKWTDHVYAAFEKNLTFLTEHNVIPKKDRKKIETIFNRHSDIISCDDPGLVHNDIADWNQLVDKNHVSAILDWDECFSGDPVMDFAAWSVFFPYDRMKYLESGYKKVSPLPDGYTEKLHLYRLRYIVSKSVSRKTKVMFAPDPRYQEMLDYAMKILHEEFKWYGI